MFDCQQYSVATGHMQLILGELVNKLKNILCIARSTQHIAVLF